jgi:hypothetical protein
LIREFGDWPYYDRREHLSIVRTYDHASRQKVVPVLTSLLTFALGGLTTSAVALGAEFIALPLGFALVSTVAISIVGKKEAKRESKYAVWTKALEDIHNLKATSDGPA